MSAEAPPPDPFVAASLLRARLDAVCAQRLNGTPRAALEHRERLRRAVQGFSAEVEIKSGEFNAKKEGSS